MQRFAGPVECMMPKNEALRIAILGAGPIGLEGDRGQMEYRRIRLKTGP